jgi:hypothetical protein
MLQFNGQNNDQKLNPWSFEITKFNWIFIVLDLLVMTKLIHVRHKNKFVTDMHESMETLKEIMVIKA